MEKTAAALIILVLGFITKYMGNAVAASVAVVLGLLIIFFQSWLTDMLKTLQPERWELAEKRWGHRIKQNGYGVLGRMHVYCGCPTSCIPVVFDPVQIPPGKTRINAGRAKHLRIFAAPIPKYRTKKSLGRRSKPSSLA